MPGESLSPSEEGGIIWVNGKPVARIENRSYIKTVSGSRHFLRVPPAIAFDADTWDAYRHLFDSVQVTDRDTLAIRSLTADQFDSKRFEIDRGFGRQYAVVLDAWDIRLPDATKLPPDLGDAA